MRLSICKRRGTLAPIAALVLAAFMSTAQAGVLLFDFSYTASFDVAGNPVGPVSASGEFTTTDVLIGGAYTVLGITGIRDLDVITALVAPGGLGGNDNLLFPGGPPFVDNSGITYTAGGVNYNFYNSGGGGNCAGPLEISSVNSGTGCSTEFKLASFTVTPHAAVPEPLSMALVATGLLALGLVRRATVARRPAPQV